MALYIPHSIFHLARLFLFVVIHKCNIPSSQRSRDDLVTLRSSSLCNSHNFPIPTFLTEGKFEQCNIFSFVAKLSQKKKKSLNFHLKHL